LPRRSLYYGGAFSLVLQLRFSIAISACEVIVDFLRAVGQI